MILEAGVPRSLPGAHVSCLDRRGCTGDSRTFLGVVRCPMDWAWSEAQLADVLIHEISSIGARTALLRSIRIRV